MTVKSTYNINEIDVEEIGLYNFTAKSGVELRESVIDFSVYEDLWSNFMTAEITLTDSQGIVEEAPIFGEEFVRIKFKTPTVDQLVEKLFTVQRVDRQKINERTDIIVLSLISLEAVISMTTSVNKSFVEKKISKIAQLVFDDEIRNSPKTFGVSNEFQFNVSGKGVVTEESLGLQNFVSTGMTPFEFLNYLATEAQSEKYIESDYVFYEDRDQFNFRTISSLIDTDPVDSFYLADPATDEDRNNDVKKYQIIQNFQWDQQFDLVERLASGMYDNTVSTIDPILKKFEEPILNYEDGKRFEDFTNLADKPLGSRNSHYKNLKGETYSRYIVGNLSDDEYRKTSYLNGRTVDSNGNILDYYTHFPYRKHNYLNHKISKLSQLDNSIKASISIPGNSNLKVGQVINVFIPSTRATEEKSQQYNRFFGQENPKFLITALTHRYSYKENLYYTIMEVVKDSYAEEPKDNSLRRESGIFT